VPKTYTIEEYEDHFWSRVERRAPSECWPWRGEGFVRGGYGSCGWPRCLLSADGPRRANTASNVAWGLANRAVPLPYVHICHSCDNPPCCNPAHLRADSAYMNNRDMVVRERSAGQVQSRIARRHRDLAARYRELILPWEQPLWDAALSTATRITAGIENDRALCESLRTATNRDAAVDREREARIAGYVARVTALGASGRSRLADSDRLAACSLWNSADPAPRRARVALRPLEGPVPPRVVRGKLAPGFYEISRETPPRGIRLFPFWWRSAVRAGVLWVNVAQLLSA